MVRIRLSFVRNHQMVFQSGCTIFHSHQQWTRVPVVPPLLQHLMWSVFQILAIVKGVQGYLTAVLFKKKNFKPAYFQTRTLVKLLMFYLMSVLSHVQLFATRWTVAHKAPRSVKFFRQKFWSGLPFPTPGYLSDPGIETVSPALPALAGDSLPRCRLGSPHTTTTRLHFSQKAK